MFLLIGHDVEKYNVENTNQENKLLRINQTAGDKEGAELRSGLKYLQLTEIELNTVSVKGEEQQLNIALP